MNGYCFHKTFDDHDDFISTVPSWDFQWKQLGYGKCNLEMMLYKRDDIELVHSRIPQHYEMEGITPKGFLTITVPAVPFVRWVWHGITIPANSVMVYPPPRTMDCVLWDDWQAYSLSIRIEDWSELCIELGYPSLTKEIEQTDFIRCDPKALAEVRRMFRRFTDMVGSPLYDNMESLIYEEIRYAIPIKLIHMLASAKSVTRKRSERNRNKIVREVKQYLDTLPDTRPKITELCRMFNVSQRTLEYAFHDNFGVTPERYLKSVRLNQVRNLLRKMSSQDTKIIDIASRFGFWHMGQFAADYRKLFGELPSETFMQHS